MTENELRQALCAEARRYLGYCESNGSHRKLIDLYNRIEPLPGGYRMRYTDPWCAAFVSAVGAAAGMTEILLPECSCERMIALYRAAGRFEERDERIPRPGDLVMYDWQDDGRGDCRGEADHVGIVLSVGEDWMKVIEGNKSHAVGTRSLHLDGQYIRGYCCPDYAGLAERRNAASPMGFSPREKLSAKPTDEGDPAAPSASTGDLIPPSPRESAPHLPSVRTGASSPDGRGTSAPRGFSSGRSCHPASPASRMTDEGKTALLLPLLRRGDRGESVRAAQLLLIGRGFRCGPWGADGDFGDATHGAIFRFQRSRGLETDGVIGPRTWAALLFGGEGAAA